jgi:hypothetical protein
LSDANTYAASQVKQADTASAHASMQNSVNQAGDMSVATNDRRFNDILQDSDFAITRIMANKGYGPDGGTGMAQDPATGAITFDEATPQGKSAQAVYQAMQSAAHGQAWENRLHVLADQNVLAAYEKYKANRSQIPGETQVKLDSFFTPKIRGAQAQAVATNVLADADSKFAQSVSSVPGNPEQVGARINVGDAIRAQESSGNANAPTSVNGAVGVSQILPATFKQYAKPGEDINNAADNKAVGQRIIDDLSQKYGGDPARVAVGYFSGPGNVAPVGSPTPWINDVKDGNGKSVSSYVADVTKRMNGQGAAPYKTRADYYRANYSDIIDQARTQAAQDHPDDPVYAAQATARVEQRLNDVIRQQDLSHKADSDLVYQAFNGGLTKNQRPTSIEQLTAIGPDVKAAWDRMQANNPQAALAVETRILTANGRASGHDINTYGKGFYKLFNAIHAPANDPSSRMAI